VLWPIAHGCGFSLPRFIRYIREELLIVIATTSSETVLPRMIAKLERLGCEESVVGLVIPAGYSFNLDGSTSCKADGCLWVQVPSGQSRSGQTGIESCGRRGDARSEV
jgi:Na+/H+-dicarboxylate symporter